jgi:hypothetical protein
MDEREREIRECGGSHCRNAVSLLDKEREWRERYEKVGGILSAWVERLDERNVRLVEALEQQIGKQAALIVVNKVNRLAGRL